MHLFRTKRWIWPVITLVFLAYGLHVALTVPPDADQGNAGRILYYHVPTWVAMSFCFLTKLVCSIVYLVTRGSSAKVSLRVDALAVSSAEMRSRFCFLGIATVAQWARPVCEPFWLCAC